MKAYIICAIIACGIMLQTNAQKQNPQQKLQTIASPKLNQGWFTFDKEVVINKNNISEVLLQKGILTAGNELRSQQTTTDSIGFAHTKFRQYYNNYPIAFATFLLHEKAGEPASGNGILVDISDKINTGAITISHTAAIDAAKKRFPAKQYAWENQQAVAEIALRTQNKMSYYPANELVWLPDSIYKPEAAHYTLAYRFVITGLTPEFSKEVYINAADGSLLKYFEQEYTCGSSTSFASNYNGTRTGRFNLVDGNYKMIDDCSWNDIYVSNNSNFYIPIYSSTSTWANTILNNSAFTTQWAAATAQSYYDVVHGRHGFDGTGLFRVDARQNTAFPNGNGTYSYNNASFDATGILRVGNGQSAGGANTYAQDDWNALDIIAHEFTHGVTFHSANLVYEKEPGALNESFSDIFGATCYQQNSFLNTHIWDVGWDRTNPSNPAQHTPIRKMDNPESFGDPGTYYSSPNWQSTTVPGGDTLDKWGVHRNSGVQNLMYVLLVQGGSGTNASGFNYNVAGVGFAKARAIAYRALTVYLTETSQYSDSRVAWIRAAEDLYGRCSAEAISTGAAWRAVGLVGPFSNGEQLCGTYAGNYIINNSVFINGGGTCTAIVNSSATMQLKAGSVIYLKPGFTATAGSYVQASIATGCSETTY